MSSTSHFFSADSARRHLSLVLFSASQTIPPLPSTFLQTGYNSLPTGSAVSFPQSLRSLSVCISTEFNPTRDSSTLSSILRRAARGFSPLTEVDVLVTSGQWRKSDDLSHQLLEWLRNMPQEIRHFRLVTSCPSVRTEVIYAGRRVKTIAAVPFDLVSNEILESLSQLPHLEHLEFGRRLMSPLHPYNPERSLAALRLHLWSFGYVKSVSVSLLLGDVLSPTLRAISALPECRSLEFTEWVPAVTYSQPERQEIVRSIRIGLAGFHHLRTLIIPSKTLRESLREVLGTLRDLEEVITSENRM
ncbi:hypothetical protein AAF712_005353 [Marasmius tenuissimus]|uniref:Uncharacterized protein n=1 Tax=Marasmius tenuissimus TaxID=585030 RepID=A0ABR3A3N9_9AGAR